MLIQRPEPARKVITPLGPSKPQLEMFRLPVFRVHYKKLEAYVEQVFRQKDFDFLIAAGVEPGECPEYELDGTLPTTEWQRRAHDLRCGRRTKSVQLILNVLVHDGFIPAGRYTISTHPLADPTTQYTTLLKRVSDPLAPECLQFKEKHRDDLTFTARAVELDQAAIRRAAEMAPNPLMVAESAA